MRILVVGGGGREHALVWKITQSPMVTEIYCAPGNAGIAGLACCVPIAADDITGLLDFARRAAIDLTVVGPEAPLVSGIVDAFQAAGLPIFGPSRGAARLEGSKIFAKELMQEAGIPTAAHATFTEPGPALAYLEEHPGPVVVKADGLAAGKGVVVAPDAATARAAVREMFGGKFGPAGRRVILEERLEGEEVSILALCDGKTAIPLLPSQDHKRVGEGDTGPNTGGMGACAPVPFYTPEIAAQVEERVLRPVIRTMAAAGHPYRGVLYAGLMLTREGPKVLEFNCRFGDPETQPLMLLLASDLVELMLAAVNGELAGTRIAWYPGAAAGVVLAAGGYPGPYAKGDLITGLEAVAPGVEVFHAGTAMVDDQVVTSGGRVMCVTARGEDLRAALDRVYNSIRAIHFQGMHYRRDIGRRALEATQII
ncbi:Phosphoribosylamine--glycine ligase [Moorella thermoacetica]|uniref:Phosphoribosylamine--glycine ligase n=1 Tax=Neomoorella thermoacetica TaxID=1525 RepID=A0AAC9MVR7_NEOTH|nr:phosphoribosylamine--glycine ligase [Moorella thermoacetica]AOQ25006.1 Phosphoribosylamine--glycine ligase [Moorella thermoacetica]TYL15452.1 Phosphoribosylamine--glycine ligase [Moorella thermoacetica]